MSAHVSRSLVTTLLTTVAVTVSLVSAAPATAADNAFPKTAIVAQQVIEQSLAATGATSLTAGFTDLQGLQWQGTTGIVEAGGPAPSATTRYGIGSTTKMFATAAVMQLVDEGLVDLDKPVVQYLPTFTMQSPQYRQITVRMLLNHSAGFPGSTYANGFTTVPYDGYAANVLANLARSNLKTTPGAMSVYCNDCFTVAGELVAAVSGMPFTAYVDKELLAPLGMTQSEFITGPLPAAGTVARVVTDGRTAPLEVTNVYASGGLMSTPSDMLSFARMLMLGGTVGATEVLADSSIEEMGKSQLATTLDPVTRGDWHYGLGWDTVRDLSLEAVGVRAWVKGGDTADYHASLIVAPDVGLAAFVAGAGSYGSSAAQKVAEEILLNALAERGEIPAVPARIGTDQPAKATPTEADFAKVLGIYLGTPGINRRVTRGSNDTIVVSSLVNGAWTPGATPMSFRTDGAWWPDTPSATSLHTVKGWGRTYLVVTLPNGYGNAMGDEIIGQRVDPAAPIAKQWRSRLGTWLYVSDLPSSTIWLGQPQTVVSEIPELPGYLELSSLSPVDARRPDQGSMFLQVPLMFGRDLDDLVPINKRTMRMGSSVMVDRDLLTQLHAGRSTVRIDSAGYGAWREVAKAGTMTVRGAQAWYVYDANVHLLEYGTGPQAVQVSAGSLILLLDDANGSVNVSLAATD